MDFSRPYLLTLPLALVPLTLIGRAIQHRKLRDWRALGQSGDPGRDRGILFSAAIIFFMIAVAGPRWGALSSPTSSTGREVVLLIDVSRSMAAEDAIPNRLGAAVLSAETLVKSLPSTTGGRVAVVEFAGRGVLKCPMTENLGAVLESLRDLEIGADGSMGTDLGDGVLMALDVFEEDPDTSSRTIVVLSDGEDHEGTWPGLLDRVKASGVRIHSVVIGDETQGTPIPIVTEGRVERLRHDGEIVRSRSNETSLKAFRDASHGTLVRAGRTPVDLGGILRASPETAPPIPVRRTHGSSPQPRYQFFVVAGLVLLLMTFRIPSRRFAALLAIVSINAGFLPPTQSISDLNRIASQAYRAGEYERALEIYDQVRVAAPREPMALYNVAATLFQMGRYAEARTAYEKARERANVNLRLKIDFAIGNIAVMMDQPEEAIRLYDDCMTSQVSGKEMQSIKRDAAINLAYARTLLPPPPSPDPDGQRKSPKPRPGPGPNSDRSPPPDRSETKTGAENNSSLQQTAPPAGKSPPSAADPEPQQNQTPDERLKSMLAAVQKGRIARQSDRPPAALPTNESKDW